MTKFIRKRFGFSRHEKSCGLTDNKYAKIKFAHFFISKYFWYFFLPDDIQRSTFENNNCSDLFSFLSYIHSLSYTGLFYLPVISLSCFFPLLSSFHLCFPLFTSASHFLPLFPSASLFFPFLPSFPLLFSSPGWFFSLLF